MGIAQIGMERLLLMRSNFFSRYNLYLTSLTYYFIWHFAHFVVTWSFC